MHTYLPLLPPSLPPSLPPRLFREFSCFDGMRAISCGWVIIYHVLLWQTRFIMNPEVRKGERAGGREGGKEQGG